MDERRVQLDRTLARRVVLVQAIDEADTDGRLLGGAERERIEQEALIAARDPADATRLDAARYLGERAERVLATVAKRNPRLASLQDAAPWQGWLAWGLPLAACVLGAAIDRIDNPEKVNMLSPPLLAVLLWNLLAYLWLLLSPLLPLRWREPAWLQDLALRGMPSGGLRGAVAGRFHMHWFSLARGAQAHWLRRVLHATAAGWGLGLGLSIVLGGLVRQYRVGWESTLLDLPQVHAFLQLLFAPVVALLPFEPFGMAQLQRMHFASGADIGVQEARHWVWLYLALLLMLVVLPRLLLALYSGWRAHLAGRTVQLDLAQPYYAETLARVSPVRVVLCLLSTTPQGRNTVLRVLREAADQPALQASAPQSAWTVLATERGDQLRVLELEPLQAAASASAAPAEPAGKWRELLARWTSTAGPSNNLADTARTMADLVLAVTANEAEAAELAPVLRWLGKPVLVVLPDATDACQGALQEAGVQCQAVDLRTHARHWQRDAALVRAMAALLPPMKAAGFARVASAWSARHEARFADAMRLVAAQLLQAARESEDLPGAQLSLRRLVDAGSREAGQQVRAAAMEAMAQRLRDGEAQTLAQLLRLHAIEEPVGAVLQQRLDQDFLLQQSVDSREAAVGGATTGAAMGAGIDLMTGGLTLGAAAALGALVGGAAAFTAAHWKNRTAPHGGAQLQLGDEMLQSLAEAAVLRYLAVAHWGRNSSEQDAMAAPAAWRSEVVAAVEAQRTELAAIWAAARAGEDGHTLLLRTAELLQALVRKLLLRL